MTSRQRRLLAHARAAGWRWACIPGGVIVGVMAGVLRTVRPLRWPEGEPFDPSGIPFWPFVVGGAVAGLVPLVAYVMASMRGEAWLRAARERHPDAVVVSAYATRFTSSALVSLVGPPAVDDRELLVASGPQGVTIEVLGPTGRVIRVVDFGPERLRGAVVRPRSTTADIGYDVCLAVVRGDGTLAEVPLHLRSLALEPPTHEQLGLFADSVVGR